MIKKVWLILADILVIGVLLFSLSLLYLFPAYYVPSKTAPPKLGLSDVSQRKHDKVLSPSELNVSFSIHKEMNITEKNMSKHLRLEDILKMSQEVTMQEYPNRQVLVYTSLQKRLNMVSGEEGNPLYIRIFKSEAILEVWVAVDGRYIHLKDYPVCAYSGHLGPKLKEGDKQAPEGFYRVYKKQLNPHSRFHLAFDLGYPNAYDRAHHRTGSYLMVHGDCRSIGCYAMTDEKIEEIYGLIDAALKAGQPYVPVHIFPFYMDDEAMDAHSESKWYDFWMELKEGYDYFEAEETPPLIKVINGKYEIEE